MEVPGLATASAQPWDLAQGRTGPALRRHITRGRCSQPRGAARSSRRHRGSAGTWCRSSHRGEAPRAVGAELALVVRLVNSIMNQTRWVEKSRASLVVTHSADRPTWRLSLSSGGWRGCRPARSPRGSGRARVCTAATRGGACIGRSEHAVGQRSVAEAPPRTRATARLVTASQRTSSASSGARASLDEGLRKSGPTEFSLPEWTRSKRLGNGTETPAWLRKLGSPVLDHAHAMP